MMIEKLTDHRVMLALRDIARNDGMMWEPNTGVDAIMLLYELRRRGWVHGNVITDAGRAALKGAHP